MSDKNTDNQLGLFLKRMLKERSISMRKFSELTSIDIATISRIINGKRKANPAHLQKFADCLGVPITELFELTGFSMEHNKTIPPSDIGKSVESIEQLLESTNLIDDKFSIANVERQLVNFEHYAQTEDGRENIFKSFGEKIKKTGSIGPFISELKEMYENFRLAKGTPRQLALLGSALIYFIVSVDVLPDYIFPLGYIDDAMAVHIVTNLLTAK
jgi:uncharacterized membrane protein YkvA (DUF1232 family)/DNA-binding Xre family transcriptional regulator